MFKKGKVSVIVPIYKVEKYIYRCLESIISQSYKDIEIILVDDGSPDNCGKIADHYQEIDQRIKVIHKENGGLSDARNFGMKEVTGEFTMFVDSDDWLEKDAIKVMINKIVKYKADVVQSAFYYAYEEQLLFDQRYYKQDNPPDIINNQLLMKELVINEKVKNFAWGKLYRSEIISGISFKKGVLFEDVFWAHQVMHRVEKFVLVNQPLYYYYQRDDSIVANYTPKNLDIIKGLIERHKFIERYYQNLAELSHKNILKMCLIHYNLLILNRKKDKSGIHRRNVQSYIRDNYTSFKKAISNDKELKGQLFLFSIHPFLLLLFLAVRKGLRRIKFLEKNEGLKRVEV
ncbi:glycosyltransferase family 2 protein [Oceanobacillus halophilus]|uniref:Glycosyltransferase family 2 protein n=1 Tax=Oceanobacillus halophilus TaxID=930130 RepID=A0A495A255_9BACI|nr:glycosyltransferase family 2 protein [Oceanobacillus halophilus]RKQ33493.1 glycosyltransferase family 2 protein [Oceanobacillus halophilus]